MINKEQILTIIIFCIIGFFLVPYLIKYQSVQPQKNVVTKEFSPISFNMDNYFPIQKGDYWIYEGIKKEETEDGKVETNNVQKRIEVLEIQDISDGRLIVLGGSEPTNYLIKDNTIDLNPDLPLEAKFVWTFPLYVGQKFGSEEDLRNSDDNFYIELVEEKITKEILGKKYDDCFRVTSKTNADSEYKVFCYGLGIIEEGYKHNGTVLEWNYRLTSSNKI